MTAPDTRGSQRAVEFAAPHRVLWATLAVVAYAGLCAEAWKALEFADRFDLVPLLSLSYEGNLPTWFVSCLLYSCAVLLALIAASTRQSRGPHVAHWWGLAVAFLYISLDETARLHEQMNHWFDLGGVLFFGWVIPAAIVVFVFGLAYLRFLAHLTARTRRRFVLAGAIYVGGALGMELPLGYWTDRAGDDNFVYALIDWVEESMELCGVALFALALLEHLAGRGERIRVAVAAEPSSAAAPLRRAWILRPPGLIGVWLAAALIGGAVVATGYTEYQRYEDRHGHALYRDDYQGEDLRSELVGGQRFVHAGAQRFFDRHPERRGLAVLLLLSAALAISAGALATRTGPDVGGST